MSSENMQNEHALRELISPLEVQNTRKKFEPLKEYEPRIKVFSKGQTPYNNSPESKKDTLQHIAVEISTKKKQYFEF